ncbi:MAG: gluconate 2-dehydrogenase subunit 3 family protein [Chitinophagaceae bacterium]|nr:gluconate 2-dehydrogenase subunit 3 family protein [Chitinophagaceae bacterium]
MQRRTVIKNIVIMAGGIALLPSCSGDRKKASILLKNLNTSAEQEALLAEIAETILPETGGSPGAKSMNLHLFTMKMVDDCHTAEEQKLFTKGLNKIDQIAEDKYGVSFAKCTPEQRKELLVQVAEDKSAPKEAATFLKITKQRVIQGFTNSKYVMTDLKQYEMVPGRYNGYFPVEKN